MTLNMPSPGEIIVAQWNQTANEMVMRYGIVRGTSEFLCRVLDDEYLGNQIALVSSFGIESAVSLKLMAEINPSIPVILVNTGYLFCQTFKYRDLLKTHLRLTDVRTPGPTQEQFMSFNPYGDPPTCCDAVKKEISMQALRDFPVWISGRKRYQGGARSDLPMVELFEDKIKLNPMALWTETHIESFMREHELPDNPLKAMGYGSAGCASCTIPGRGREGRWPGKGKMECGLHIDGSGI